MAGLSQHRMHKSFKIKALMKDHRLYGSGGWSSLRRSTVQAGSFAKLGKQDQECHHGPAFVIG